MTKCARLVFTSFLLGLLSAGCQEAVETRAGSREARGGGRAARTSSDTTDGVEAVSVKAFRSIRRPISTYIVSNTTLESRRKVSVYAHLNTLVREIEVEEGVSVQAGQLLVRLDDTEIRNEYQQAQIAVDQSRLSVQQGEVKALQTAANFERARSLHEQKLISKQEFDLAELSNRTDELAYQSAKQQMVAAQSRLEAAEIQLDYAEIRSPLNGIVTERLIEVGDRVMPNQAVFSVEQFDPLWTRIFVPERNLPKLQVGQMARLRIETFPERRFQARIKMINPTVDSASGTVKVTLEITEGLDVLRPGMFATAFIATETHDAAVVIPKLAITRERDENRVFVVGPDQTVEERTVTLGFTEESDVEIVSGVRAGEAVVTVGQEGLSHGYPVNVLAWEGEPNTATTAESDSDNPAPSTEQAPRALSQGPRTGQRGFSPERLKRVLENNPELKQEYQRRLEEDPSIGDDPEKQQETMQELFRRFGSRRGRF